MSIQVNIQNVTKAHVPSHEELEQWAALVFSARRKKGAIGVRIVGEKEIQSLNHQFRKVDNPTNILSFPYEDVVDEENVPILGDLAVCASVVKKEAIAQKKELIAHWAHLIIHGCLHLQGYTHNDEENAKRMETKEIQLLKKLGFKNPYQSN
ncbi:MAG: rRNA maturation RNase YbeY [Pseudomonadota bacterium]|nr:rRNA maturation RNase YbeY [Gammaproteobacteria bacterium]MBU1558844.1 rRNA maturation RNase YbeY [Gammaproteobacteria bacterium]MBU1926773.1 rRNA maturation RNase YbeY [Gammaproteobacteria bacterium]MBU2545785.1 rRNA maturation RNase YbeY [Gammaproteobacteria bacterium]